jgi:hypothetical protein
MRAIVVVAVVLIPIAGALGQDGDKGKTIKRYGIELDTKKYPQSNPKEALGSVLKAIGDNRVDYLLAHLADPAFVDKRIGTYASQLDPSLNEQTRIVVAFDRLLKRTIENFLDDPTKLEELKRFFKDGDWADQESIAVASLKNQKARQVFMKRIGDDRWVLQDRAQ